MIDDDLSPKVALRLCSAGHDAVPVRDLGIPHAQDPVVLETARLRAAVLVSADTDFTAILAATGAEGPSVIQFREGNRRRADEVAAAVLRALDLAAEALAAGAVVTIRRGRIRVGRLPIRRSETRPGP